MTPVTGEVSTLDSGGDQILTADAAGNIYFGDFSGTIKSWTAATGQITTLVTGLGFANPISIAVDGGGNLYFSDYQGMQKWTASTYQITTVVPTTYGINTLVAGATGNLYFFMGRALQKWTASTGQLTTLIPALNDPLGLAVDAQGDVYFANFETSGTVEKWTAATVQLTTVLSFGSDTAQELAFDAAGNLYIHVYTNTYVNGLRLTSIQKWNPATGQSVTLPIYAGPLKNPGGGIAVDAARNLYLGDIYGNTIQKWNASTAQLSTLVSGGLSYPSGIALDTAGNLYIANTYSGSVDKWTAATAQLTTLVSGLMDPDAVAVDAAGNVFIGDYYNVSEWNKATAQVAALPIYTTVSGLALNGAGTLYVASFYLDAIIAAEPPRWESEYIIGSGLSGPMGIATDGAGNLYIADAGHNSLKERHAATGQVTTLVSQQLNSPASVTVGQDGAVYVTDNYNPVGEFVRGFVGPATLLEPLAAGSGYIQVLPPGILLDAVSDQSWLTIVGQNEDKI